MGQTRCERGEENRSERKGGQTHRENRMKAHWAIEMETKQRTKENIRALTLMGRQTHTHCFGRNRAKPLSHRKRAAKSRQGIIWCRGRPSVHEMTSGATRKTERAIDRQPGICHLHWPVGAKAPTSWVSDWRSNSVSQASWLYELDECVIQFKTSSMVNANF